MTQRTASALSLPLGPSVNASHSWRLTTRQAQALLSATLLACALWFASCATEGPPHPPRIQRPEAVHDLAVTQVGRSLILTFHSPGHAADGRRLTKPIEVQIFRMTVKAGQLVPTVFTAGKPWVDLTPQDLPRFEHGGTIRYGALLTPAEFQSFVGKTFDFMVQTLTRGFRRRPFNSDSSNVAAAKLIDVSKPVEDLRAYPAQKSINLKWTTPSISLTGKPLQGIMGYRIFRSESGKLGSFLAIGTSSDASYADKNFAFGHNYYYVVRALFGEGKTAAESDDSKLAVITPRDIFPPRAPQGLTAIYTGKAVELVWTPNLESDLAGYNIYRREDHQPPMKLNRSLQHTAIYRDFTAQAGHRYLYWITAVDLSRNESDPSAAVSVETR